MPTQGKISTVLIGDKPFVSPYNSVGREVADNLYIELAPSETSKVNYYYVKTPGLALLNSGTRTATATPSRGTYTASNGTTFCVNGNILYSLSQYGIKTYIATLNSFQGTVRFTDNTQEMLIVDGMSGYIYQFNNQVLGPNFRVITDEYFPGNAPGTLAPTFCVFMDTYFLVNDPSTNTYYWSNPYYAYSLPDTSTLPYDPNVANGYWTPLQTNNIIARNDIILSLIECTNLLWIFGRNSIEVHYDTGNYNTGLFARYNQAIIDMGTAAAGSVAKYATNVFWLGADRTGALGVFRNEGFQPKRISTRGIEQIIQEFNDYSDAIGFTYSHVGHTFYVIQFPSADKTLVYDLVTDSWHQRTYLDADTGITHAWHGMYPTFNWSENVFGDSVSDAYYWADQTHYYNDNPDGVGYNYIKCVKTLPIAFSMGMLVRYNSAQVMFQQGVGLQNNTPDGVGQNPTVWLAWSNDSGNSYIMEKPAPMGAIGAYGTRSRITNCGSGRNRVFRITVTDPVPVVLVGMILDTVAGNR